jgi:hypothetical protein
MLDPDEVPKIICASAAQALFRYHQLSGEGFLGDEYHVMPESFVQSFITDHLGCVLTFALETNFYWLSKLFGKQNENDRRNTKTYDIAVYNHYTGGKRDDDVLIGIVEVKRGYNEKEIDADIQKINEFFTLDTNISFGAALFYCWRSDVQTAKDDALAAGHQWFSIGVAIPGELDKYAACIRWFKPAASN